MKNNVNDNNLSIKQIKEILEDELDLFCWEISCMIGDADLLIIAEKVVALNYIDNKYTKNCFAYLKKLAESNASGICYEKDYVHDYDD